MKKTKKHEYLEDPSDIDEFFLPLFELVKGRCWDQLNEEIDLIIRLTKTRLKQESPCVAEESACLSDISYLKRDATYNTLPYLEILQSAFYVKEILLADSGRPADHDFMQEIHFDIERMQNKMKNAALSFMYPKKAKQEKFLPKGRRAKKGLAALEPAIIEVIGKNPGKEITHRKIKLWLKQTFTPDSPFYFDGYELYIDGDKIVQRSEKTGREKQLKFNSVGRYITAVFKKIK